jgi:hypothetical protein
MCDLHIQQARGKQRSFNPPRRILRKKVSRTKDIVWHAMILEKQEEHRHAPFDMQFWSLECEVLTRKEGYYEGFYMRVHVLRRLIITDTEARTTPSH